MRGGHEISKSRMVINFLRDHGDDAFFYRGIVEALKDYGVKPRDAMANFRRFERKRIVYVRCYKTDER